MELPRTLCFFIRLDKLARSAPKNKNPDYRRGACAPQWNEFEPVQRRFNAFSQA